MTKYALLTSAGIFSIEGDSFTEELTEDNLLRVKIFRDSNEKRDGMPAAKEQIAAFTRVEAVFPGGDEVNIKKGDEN